jgi:hypothetical protein
LPSYSRIIILSFDGRNRSTRLIRRARKSNDSVGRKGESHHQHGIIRIGLGIAASRSLPTTIVDIVAQRPLPRLRRPCVPASTSSTRSSRSSSAFRASCFSRTPRPQRAMRGHPPPRCRRGIATRDIPKAYRREKDLPLAALNSNSQRSMV